MSTQFFECPCSKESSPRAHDAPPPTIGDIGSFSAGIGDSPWSGVAALRARDLLHMNPDELVGMAYGAEGGGGTPPTELLRVIKDRANETPWKTFRYAMAYRRFDIADTAAPYTIGRLPTKDQCVHDLPTVDQLAWYEYREQYLLLLDAVLAQPPPHKNAKRKLHYCGGWEPYTTAVLGDLPGTPLFDIMTEIAAHGADVVLSRSRWDREIVPPGWDLECATCRERAGKWEGAVNRRFRKLESFSTILERVKSGPGDG